MVIFAPHWEHAAIMISADNLGRGVIFQSALKTVDSKSIQFHMERGDFARWLHQVVGDEKLAEKLTELSNKKLASGSLRKRIIGVVGRRIKELEKAAQ